MALPPTVRTGHASAQPHNGSAMGPAADKFDDVTLAVSVTLGNE